MVLWTLEGSSHSPSDGKEQQGGVSDQKVEEIIYMYIVHVPIHLYIIIYICIACMLFQLENSKADLKESFLWEIPDDEVFALGMKR